MGRQLVDRWFNAFRNRDISTLERDLAEDFVHTSPFGEIKGKDAYLELVRTNAEAFFNHTINILDVFDCGDKIAVRYIVDEMPVCECHYVEDGKISKIYAYYHFGSKPDWQNALNPSKE